MSSSAPRPGRRGGPPGPGPPSRHRPSARVPMRVAAASCTRVGVRWPLAPPEMMIVFSHQLSTLVRAVPAETTRRWTREASTPASRRDSSSIAPFASRPTAPTMDTLAPSGAATTAWFADLPTGRTWRGPPVTVFPRRGWSGTDQEVRDALVHGEPTVRPHLGDQGPRWCGPRTGAVWSASQRGTSFGWADRTGVVWTVHSL